MGGLTYIFGLVLYSVIGIILGLLAALLAWLLAPVERRQRSARRGFLIAFLATVVLGLWWMTTSHASPVAEAEASEEVKLLVAAGSRYQRGEYIASGDAARSFYQLRGSRQQVEILAQRYALAAKPYSASLWRDKGPGWWPGEPCDGGLTYDADVSAKTPAAFTLSWCPSTGVISIVRYEY